MSAHLPENIRWIPCSEAMPEPGVEVLTKIHDAAGCRNETSLKFKSNLWWFPDMSMHVYYTPTHWAVKEAN